MHDNDLANCPLTRIILKKHSFNERISDVLKPITSNVRAYSKFNDDRYILPIRRRMYTCLSRKYLFDDWWPETLFWDTRFNERRQILAVLTRQRSANKWNKSMLSDSDWIELTSDEVPFWIIIVLLDGRRMDHFLFE